MQGVHAFESKAKASIDLESFVATDHFLRRIDKQLQRVEEQCRLAIREAIADRGYGSAEIIKTPKAKGTDARFVLRPADQDIFDEVQAQMDEPQFKQDVSERMWRMEGLLAGRVPLTLN